MITLILELRSVSVGGGSLDNLVTVSVFVALHDPKLK